MAENRQNGSHADQVLHDTLLWVRQQLAEGASEEDTAQALIQGGVEPAVATELVAAAASIPEARPSVGSRIAGQLAGLVGLVVVFLVLNGLLWGGQALLAIDDKREAEALETQLESLERQIDVIEAQGRAMGLSFDQQARYESMVTQYNALVPEYNEVARKAYSRWWLLPIPVPGRGTRVRN